MIEEEKDPEEVSAGENNQEEDSGVESFMTNPVVNIFAATNFRNQFRKFGIKIDDRRRHMYVIGKTGMGKTTMLENLVLNDIYAGHGVGVVDPHGDFAEKIIDYIPPHRINDVVYFNPSDLEFPIGFNILEVSNPDHKHLIASGLMAVFKKIWVDMWSSRMEYILNNTILALLDFPNTTLLGINRLLSDKVYRKRVVQNVKDPVIKAFWEQEFASYNDRYAQEAVAPIQNKIGQFLSASVIRNIVAQVKSKIDIRDIMDNQKIFIMNLSKGRIGEDNSALLGGMLVNKIQLTAMERVDMAEDDRKDFFLYVDEFQNFATPSFANILSEARKYHLGLILAHQYMEQLDETVREAVLGNVGTIATFRVGSTDSEILAKEFAPVFVEEDLINLPKFNIYLKLMIDGVSSKPFSANTLPPIGHPTGTTEKIIKVSRERYSISRDKIEDMIMKWSGFDEGDDKEKTKSVKSKENYSSNNSSSNNKNNSYNKNTTPNKTANKPSYNNKDSYKNNTNVKKDYSKSSYPTNSSNSTIKKDETVRKPHLPVNKPESVSLVDTKQKGLSLSSLTQDDVKEKNPKGTSSGQEKKSVNRDSQKKFDNKKTDIVNKDNKFKSEKQKEIVKIENKVSLSELKSPKKEKSPKGVPSGKEDGNKNKKQTLLIEKKVLSTGRQEVKQLMPGFVDQKKKENQINLKTIKPDEVVKVDKAGDNFDDDYRNDR